MKVARNGSSVIVDVTDTDFIEAAIHTDSVDGRGYSQAGGVVTSSGLNMTITFKMDSATYSYIADVAAGERKSSGSGFTDNEARRISDEFLNESIQLGDYKGIFDLEQSEVDTALAGIVIDDEITFTGEMYSGETYVLRADVGTARMQVYLIPTSLFRDPVPGDYTFVDSYPFSIPFAEGDDTVVPAIMMQEIQAFKTTTITKNVNLDLGGRRMAYNQLSALMSYVQRYGYAYADMKKIYEETLIPMEKFGFMTRPTNVTSRYPNVLFGIPSSANCLAVIESSNMKLFSQGLTISVGGTATVTYIVGSIYFPSKILFKETLETFDIISDGVAEWEEFGPIRNEYIGKTGAIAAECMHSWQGRSTLGIKAVSLDTAGVED
jgi:hypothetical protein